MAAIAAIGMFDGVHLGHRAILDALAEQAVASGREPIAFTFAVHPRETLTGACPGLITDIEQKRSMISPVARTVVLDFGKDDFAMTAVEFLERLKTAYGVDAVVMGYNNHIGSDRRDAGWLAANCDTEIFEVGRYCDGAEAPSSSRIREYILNGDVAAARELLGHAFAVRGTVVHGREIGRTIGFPTANIEPADPRQILPADGVYAVAVHIGDELKRGMANIGTRPTLSDGRGKTLEVNIFDFEGELYGKTVSVDFLGRLRPESAFADLDALKAQLQRDKTAALKF